MSTEPERSTRRLAAAQGGYYVLTGIWTIVSPGSFEALAGPRSDRRLASSFGVLVAGVGALLIRSRGANARAAGLASAASIAVADVIRATEPRAARAAYLADALVQLLFVAAWAAIGGSREPRGPTVEGAATNVAASAPAQPPSLSVDEISEQSFPASDPPPYWARGAIVDDRHPAA
jgi:hypothetical protein